MRKRWRRGNDESSFPTLFVDKNPPWHSFPYSEACFPCARFQQFLSTCAHFYCNHFQFVFCLVLNGCDLRFRAHGRLWSRGAILWKKLEQWQKVYNSHFILINANHPSLASPKKSVFAQMNARGPSAQVIIIGMIIMMTNGSKKAGLADAKA